MSFLHQLRQQAQALQTQQTVQHENLAALTAATQAACQRVWHYLDDLCRQLNVIEPVVSRLSLDGKTPWPDMKQTGFRFDARKKMLRDQEVFDYLAMGWQLVPAAGGAAKGQIRVNFPPDLERVERSLRAGQVPHERKEQRHPQTRSLQAIVFEHETAARASVTVTAEHDSAELLFRLAGIHGFSVVSTRYRAVQVDHTLLDEMAKLIVGQPSRFA